MLLNFINKIVRHYKSHGILASTIFLEPEFQLLYNKVASTSLNTSGSRNHVPEVEGQINVIKEQMWAHHTNLPFPRFTQGTTIDISKNIVMLLNKFPPKTVLSTSYILRTIRTGKTLIWNKMYNLSFGAYAQLHKDRNITNTMREQTQGAICLVPT